MITSFLKVQPQRHGPGSMFSALSEAQYEVEGKLAKIAREKVKLFRGMRCA